MKRVVNIAMTIEAPDDASLAALYRSGLAQMAIAMSSGTKQGRLHINGDLECGSHRTLTGVFVIDTHLPFQPPQPELHQ